MATLTWPAMRYAGSHVFGGLTLLRKADARGLFHRSWGVLKGAHGSWLKPLAIASSAKGSARGPSAGCCFLVGPFRSDMRVDASLRREAFSPSLARMHAGLPALQLRFLVTPCLAGVCVTALAAGWRVLVRPSNILAASRRAASAASAGCLC